jgi:hypothetical protein
MSPIAERLVLRVTTPAKRDHRSSGEAERISGRVLDSDVVANYAIRTVVDDYDCVFILIAHYSLSSQSFKQVRLVIVAHTRAYQKASPTLERMCAISGLANLR